MFFPEIKDINKTNTWILGKRATSIMRLSWAVYSSNTGQCLIRNSAKLGYSLNLSKSDQSGIRVMFKFKLYNFSKPPENSEIEVNGFSPRLNNSKDGQWRPSWFCTESNDRILLQVKKSCRKFLWRKDPSGSVKRKSELIWRRKK